MRGSRRYNFDVIQNSKRLGNLNIAGYWNDMAEIPGAVDKAIDLFFDLHKFKGVVLFEGWTNEPMREALLRGFKERNIRIWEAKLVTSGPY